MGHTASPICFGSRTLTPPPEPRPGLAARLLLAPRTPNPVSPVPASALPSSVRSTSLRYIGMRHAARVPPPPILVSRRLLQVLALWRMQVVGCGCMVNASFLRGRVSVIQYFFLVIWNFSETLVGVCCSCRRFWKGRKGLEEPT